MTGDSTASMVGATASIDGESGLVPKPSAGDQNKFLNGDGTFDDVPDPQVMIGATSSTNGKSGLTPIPSAGSEDKVLQGNGKWGHKLQIDVVEQNGVYGYINSSDVFVPFKSQADIDAAVTAARVGTATAADVLAGKTFTINLSEKAHGFNRGSMSMVFQMELYLCLFPMAIQNILLKEMAIL